MAPTDQTEIERPIATVDLAVFALSEGGLSVLLTRRATEPFSDTWSLPGGWIHTDQDGDLDGAARRILRDKTGVEAPYLEQVRSVGSADRDPRGWSLSVVYLALRGRDPGSPRPGTNTADAQWVDVAETGVRLPLAFDHAEILAGALTRLRDKVEYSTLPAHLLPPQFTLGELQAVYEQVLGRRMDKSAFRKRVAEADFVEAVPGQMRRASNRPAQIYRLRQPRSRVILYITLL
jgi:8-oxo-dGTP diphosphatase